MQLRVLLLKRMRNSGKRVMNKRSLFILPIIFLSACAEYRIYSPAPVNKKEALQHYQTRDINATTLRDWLAEKGLRNEDWPRTSWDVESLVLVGEFYSAQLAVEKEKVKVAEAAELTASQKRNPEIGLTSEYHSDREGGISPWTLGGMFSWVYEKPEKIQTRVDYAKAVTELAKLSESEIKWQIRDGVVDPYQAVLVAVKKQSMLLAETVVLQSGLDVVTRSLELGQSSKFELSSIRLELQESQLASNELMVLQIEARTELALAAGLPADAMQSVNLEGRGFSQLPSLEASRLTLEALQTRVLTERPDIRRALAEYAVAEADLHREVAKQYPDLMLSPGFIFDQSDNIWAFASNFILPLNDVYAGPIGEAEARRSLQAQEILALQTTVLQQVHQARIIYQTRVAALKDADQLAMAVEARQATLQRQYDLGYTDQLTLIRHELALLKTQYSRYTLEVSAWQAFAGLEDAMMLKLN